MGAEPLRRRTFVGGTHFLPQRHAGARVVARTRSDFHADEIGFGFIIAAELEVDQVSALLGHQVGELRAHTKKYRSHRAADGGNPVGGRGLTHAFTRVLAQGVSDFMAHDHGHLVVRELQLVQDAAVKSNLAAGHAIGVDLVRAHEVDLPLPLFGARVPVKAVWNDVFRNTTQANDLRVVVWAQRIFTGRLFHHVAVLLAGGLLHVGGWHQIGKY